MKTKAIKMQSRLFILFLAAAAALLLASRAGHADTQAGSYRTATSGQIQPSAPPALTTDSTYTTGAYPLHPPELPAGDGQLEVSGYCVRCHSARYITMQPPLSPEAWEAEVNKMNKAYGASIPEEISAKIAKYLQAHFTPETKGQ